jgi:hypothetical protein
MSARRGASRLLRTVVASSPSSCRRPALARYIHSSSSAKGSLPHQCFTRQLDLIVHISLRVSVHGAHFSKPDGRQVRRHHRSAAQLWRLPDAMSPEIRSTNFRAQGRAHALRRAVRHRPRPHFPTRPQPMPIQNPDRHIRCRLSREGETVRGSVSFIEHKVCWKDQSQDVCGRGRRRPERDGSIQWR